MSYTKTQWTNDTAPAINETNLNKIEQGIYDNDSHIGDLSDLETTANTDLVSAINENVSSIGDLSDLETTAQTDIVSAINEVNAKDEVKVSTTTPTNNSKVWKQFGTNLYDGSIDKVGYIVASDGSETASSAGFISDYIEVEPNTTYTFSYNSTDYSYAMRYCEYDENKTFIQRTYNSNAIYTFTTTATTKYLKLSSSLIAVDLGSAKLVLGSNEIENKEYVLDNENYVDYKIQQAGDLVVDSVRTKNLFDSSKYNTTSQVRVVDNQQGVLELNGVSGYYAGVTAKFKVKPSVTYTLSYSGVILDTSVASIIYVEVLKLDGTTRIAYNSNPGKQSITFSTTEEGVIIGFRVNNNTNVGKARYSWIQLEESAVATPYTPYQDLESNEKYTTTEQVIGTWIDGKPIYRKYVSGTTPNNSTTDLVLNVDTLVNFNIIVLRTNNNQWHPVTSAMTGFDQNHACPVYYVVSTTRVSLFINNSAYSSQPYKGWVEYTKTTD